MSNVARKEKRWKHLAAALALLGGALVAAATVMLLGLSSGEMSAAIGQALAFVLALPLILLASSFLVDYLRQSASKEADDTAEQKMSSELEEAELDGIIEQLRQEAGYEYRDLDILLWRFGLQRINALLHNGDLELMRPSVFARIGLTQRPHMARLSRREASSQL